MQALSNSLRSGYTSANAARRRPLQQHVATVAPMQQQQTSHVCQASNPNAAAAAVVAASIVLQSCIAAPQPAAAAVGLQQQQQQWQQQRQPQSSWQPIVGELSLTAAAPAVEQEEESLQDIEDDIMAQVAIPQELTDFMQMLQQGPPKNAAKLSAARKAVGFDRTVDGRVLLFSDDGEPFQVKNDMGVPGALLLRDAGGYMYYLPSTDADSLVQIDLSDDAIVAQLFANHAWEELLEPLEVVTPVAEKSSKQQQQQQPEGRLEQLRLTERDFRNAISLLRGSQQLPEEPLEDLDAQERQ